MAEAEQKFGLEKVDKLNLGLGLFVFFFSFLIYLMTVQRTVSFWDCGEFIACSYILGIPHPPGAPLFILLGRIFSILPTAADIGFRINLLSIVSSAAASMFGYFLLVKLVKDWFGENIDTLRRVGIHTGAVIGALLMSFSTTNWGSSVEAEVYGLSMLLITLLIWLTLLWAEKRTTSEGPKLLVLIFFLAVLSTSVHLTVYLIVPFLMMMMLILDESLRRNWIFWVTCIILLLPVSSLVKFTYVGGAWATILLIMWSVQKNRSLINLPFAIMVASGIAFSCQLFIIVRAAEKPAINENAPDTWQKFEDFLDRKQYGQMSMVERMFTRRGSWENQFGTHPRMGFWGFFQDQYGVSGAKFVFTLFPLGLLGMFEVVLRRWQKGVPFFLMILAATAGLVIYMNFADGTRPFVIPGDEANLEVRDRDYFWQPGFILFGLAMGLGVITLWEIVSNWTRRQGKTQLTYALLILLVLPLNAIRASFFENDRSKNHIPWDYAYNLLTSADSNAVVFTNGDNDTFPVWCLQEVYGVRKDVKIANLSLLNTDWYIKQLKHEMGVPISLTDAQIEALYPERLPDGSIRRIQDKMIDNIITNNNWKRPIHFAVTVSQENRLFRGQPIEDNLEMKGMMYRLKRDKQPNMIDLEATVDLYLNKFQYRGVADSTIYKDDNSSRLTNNYAAGFLYTAEELRKRGDHANALAMVDKSIEVVPGEWRSYVYKMQLYADLDSLERVEEMIRNAPAVVEANDIWLTIAGDFHRSGRKKQAYQLLERKLAEQPNESRFHRQLLNLYFRDSLYDSMETSLMRWVASNPSDTDAQAALREVRELKAEQSGVHLRGVDVPGGSK